MDQDQCQIFDIDTILLLHLKFLLHATNRCPRGAWLMMPDLGGQHDGHLPFWLPAFLNSFLCYITLDDCLLLSTALFDGILYIAVGHVTMHGTSVQVGLCRGRRVFHVKYATYWSMCRLRSRIYNITRRCWCCRHHINIIVIIIIKFTLLTTQSRPIAKSKWQYMRLH